MHAVVVELVSICPLLKRLVLLCGKAHDAILVKKDLKGVATEDQHVESKIEF